MISAGATGKTWVRDIEKLVWVCDIEELVVFTDSLFDFSSDDFLQQSRVLGLPLASLARQGQGRLFSGSDLLAAHPTRWKLNTLFKGQMQIYTVHFEQPEYLLFSCDYFWRDLISCQIQWFRCNLHIMYMHINSGKSMLTCMCVQKYQCASENIPRAWPTSVLPLL